MQDYGGGGFFSIKVNEFILYISSPVDFMTCDQPVDWKGNDTEKQINNYGCSKVSVLIWWNHSVVDCEFLRNKGNLSLLHNGPHLMNSCNLSCDNWLHT